MFDGSGKLTSNYTSGTYDPNPTPGSPNFARPFPIRAYEILFISGDGQFWAVAKYDELRALIDDVVNWTIEPNIQLEVGINGLKSVTTGNVTSRPNISEDPFIEGDVLTATNVTGLIIWGESNFNNAGNHEALKNAHDGVNVYVRAMLPPEPVPTLTEWGSSPSSCFFQARRLYTLGDYRLSMFEIKFGPFQFGEKITKITFEIGLQARLKRSKISRN